MKAAIAPFGEFIMKLSAGAARCQSITAVVV